MKIHKYSILLLLTVLFEMSCLTSCQKDFLETKPDKALLVPSTLADFRALLDNQLVFNRTPGLTGLADGDLVTTDAGFRSFGQEFERNTYIWAADINAGQPGYEWNDAYRQIFYTNVVLEGLKDLTGAQDIASRNEIEGWALFHRGWNYYQLAQLFCRPYNAATASTDQGVPVRLSPDVAKIEQRGTVGDTYEQMLADLLRARRLLPLTTVYKSRPTLPACYALLARIHLLKGEYNEARAYADSSLQLSSTLLDFNSLNAASTRPMPRALPDGNPEILFYAAGISNSFNGSTAVAYIDPVLFSSYATNDLRKTCLFRDQGTGRINFKGTYTGLLQWFTGLTAAETYLIRAECSARLGNTTSAMTDINSLLVKRFKSGTYTPQVTSDPEAALRLVLAERRKELVGRNTRWTDLRRLNPDNRFAQTLTRTVIGVTYTLAPGSNRFVYPIPDDEIRLSGLVQNER